MSPFPSESETASDTALSAALSAADLNTRIRELWADGELPDERRPEYEALVVEWAAAAHQDVERAA